MHIPDGYLSPATCAGLFCGSTPFWWVALQKLKRGLRTRMVPLLSLFAAFAFIIMMFNLPLPGGTTGHAVGVGIAAIVLGPWGAILALSITVMIQAMLFGDGGITAIGANCFNIAVIGSLTAYGVYRLIAARAAIDSPRRIFAAAMAGYVAINSSALATAVELGIQPLLYRDASGAALYAPYPLSIAVPAMMIGHLTVAGLAEMAITAGVVAYLQKSEPGLLGAAAPNASVQAGEPAQVPKLLWAVLVLLAILTPLGTLAVGSAWGEWSIEDYLRPDARAQIATASGGQSLPVRPPTGLQRMAQVWEAPLAGYAPAFFKNPGLGYAISAMAGTALILGIGWCVFRLLYMFGMRRRNNFIERSLASLLRASEYASDAETMAARGGILQAIDPRVKLVGLLFCVIAAAALHHLGTLEVLFCLACLMALAARVPLRRLAFWVWLPVLLFTGSIALPVLFFTPGEALYFGKIIVTEQGVRSAAFLVLRAETASTLLALLVLTTPWPWILQALRVLRCPAAVVAILGMTYRYIFEILRTALEMFESRRSRTVGILSPSDSRRVAAAAVGVLLNKSLHIGNDVHLAMQSRGFRGEVYTLSDFQTRIADWVWLMGFASVAAAALWWGR